MRSFLKSFLLKKVRTKEKIKKETFSSRTHWSMVWNDFYRSPHTTVTVTVVCVYTVANGHKRSKERKQSK